MDNFKEIAKLAKCASIRLGGLTEDIKNKALEAVANMIEKNSETVFAANQKDLELARLMVDKGELTEAVYKRLKLDANKLRDMVQGIRDLVKLPDPVNKTLLKRELDSGIILEKISCPIGVIGVIFEARPDVIAQISALAIKSGNAVILKGGKEAVNTNKVVFDLIKTAVSAVAEFPIDALQQVFSREDVAEMLKCEGLVDLIIPRGGNSLVQFIKNNTKIPVLGHADGVCHIFVDKSAKLDMAISVVVDAKTQYPSACNAVETVLVHKDFPYINELKVALKDANIVIEETPEDWHHEYSDVILSLKLVNSLEEAIEHVNTYSSGHTEAIITEEKANADKFLASVDSAGVYHNVSTRFADGFRYGFGAEVGISTNKTHARGPVGLEGLTIYKYNIRGNGHIVADYANGVKKFNHKDL